MVEQLRYWVIPISLGIGYFLLGLELIAEDVEEPFGRLARKNALSRPAAVH